MPAREIVVRLVHWRFSLLLGILGAFWNAVSVGLIAGPYSYLGSILSLVPFGLFVAAIPYLATNRTHDWWLSTAMTVGAAWLIMVVLSVPAMFFGGWIGSAGGETYFIVAHWFLGACLGVVALAILSFLLGTLARYMVRSPAA